MKVIIRICVVLFGIFPFFSGLGFSQQDYPTKAVNVVHGYSAGGPTDISIRVVGEALSRLLNQPFVVVPKPGGAQTIAASFIARSVPDGYTLGFLYSTAFSTAPYLQEVPYRLEDFKPVDGWLLSSQVLACKSEAPYKNLKDLVAAAKTQSIKFGHNGKGTGTFMTPFLFGKDAGIKLVDVPFKGDADQLVAVLGGHIQLFSGSAMAAEPLINAGKIYALVTYTRGRLTYNPEIPTLEEQGFINRVGVPVAGMFVTKGTPDAIVKKLQDASKACFNNPQVKAELAKIKQEIIYVDAKGMLEIIEKEKEVIHPILKEVGLAK